MLQLDYACMVLVLSDSWEILREAVY